MVLAILLMFGCNGSKEDREAIFLGYAANKYLNEVNKKYSELNTYVKDDSPKKGRGKLLKILNNILKENPEDKVVIDMVIRFTLDISENGILFLDLKRQYDELMAREIIEKIRNNEITASNKDELKLVNQKLIELSMALDKSFFSKKLIDYANMIATQYPYVTKPSTHLEGEVNNNAVVGSQLVGNEKYGEWKENFDGDIFWHYKKEYMFLDFINDKEIGDYTGSYDDYKLKTKDSEAHNKRYDVWRNNRNWSYYHDDYMAGNLISNDETKQYIEDYRKGSLKYNSTLVNNKLINSVNKRLRMERQRNNCFNYSYKLSMLTCNQTQ